MPSAAIADRIERVLILPVPRERVWAALIEPAEMPRWFGTLAEFDLRPGAPARFGWEEHGTEPGRIETVEPPRHLALRRRPSPSDAAVSFHGAPAPWSGSPSLRCPRGRAWPSSSPASPPCRPRCEPPRCPTTRGAGTRSLAISQRCSPPGPPRDRSPAELQAVLAALGDPTRRELLVRLAADGSGLAADLPITRQAVAKHLATLAEAGLVAERRAGKERRYSVDPEPLEDAAAWMATVGARWDRRLTALEHYLTGPEEVHDGAAEVEGSHADDSRGSTAPPR